MSAIRKIIAYDVSVSGAISSLTTANIPNIDGKKALVLINKKPFIVPHTNTWTYYNGSNQVVSNSKDTIYITYSAIVDNISETSIDVFGFVQKAL